MADTLISKLTHDENTLTNELGVIWTQLDSIFRDFEDKTEEFICEHKIKTLDALLDYLKKEKERPTVTDSAKFQLIEIVINVCSSDPVPTLDQIVSVLLKVLKLENLSNLYYFSFLRNFYLKFLFCELLCSEMRFDLIESILKSLENHPFVDQDLNPTEKSEWTEFFTYSMFTESRSNTNKLTDQETMEKMKDPWKRFFQFSMRASKNSEIWQRISTNVENAGADLFNDTENLDSILLIIESGNSTLIANNLKRMAETLESNKEIFQAKFQEILTIIETLLSTKMFDVCGHFIEKVIFTNASSDEEIDRFMSLLINFSPKVGAADRRDFFRDVMGKSRYFLEDFPASKKISVRYFDFAEAILSLKVDHAPNSALHMLQRQNFYPWKDLSNRIDNLIRLCVDYQTIEDDPYGSHELDELEDIFELIRERATVQRAILRNVQQQAQFNALRWSTFPNEKNPKLLPRFVYRMGRALVTLIDIEQVDINFCCQVIQSFKVQLKAQQYSESSFLCDILINLASCLAKAMEKLKGLNDDFHQQLSSFLLVAMDEDLKTETGDNSLTKEILQELQHSIPSCLNSENDVRHYDSCLKKMYSLTYGDEHEFYMDWWTRFWLSGNTNISQLYIFYVEEFLKDFIDRKTHVFYVVLNFVYPQKPELFHERIDDLIDLIVTDDVLQSTGSSSLVRTIVQENPDLINENHLEKLFKFLKQTSSLADCSTLVFLILTSVSDSQPKLFDKYQKELQFFAFEKQFAQAAKCLENYFVASSIIDGQKAANEYVTILIDALKQEKRIHDEIRQMIFHTLQMIGLLYRELLQSRRNEFLPFKSYAECRILLDFIDQRKLNEPNKKQMQSTQNEIEEIQRRLQRTQANFDRMSRIVQNQDKNLKRVNEKVQTVQSKVINLTDRVDSQQREIERIDSKTLSFVPEEWGSAVCQILNIRADNDWRLLGKRFGYSNSELRHWSLKADPTMMLLNEWFMTHKTDEATYGLLKMLNEIGRTDASKIIRTAIEAAGQIIPDDLPMEIKRLPPVFLSYQWNSQKMVTNLKQNLEEAGFSSWMDIGQMGGGDKLFAKIDAGIRGAKVVICCINKSYSLSDNCLREVHLAISTGKTIIPMQMEKIDWPPEGSLGPIMSEYLYIRFYDRKSNMPDYWPADKFSELLGQIRYYVAPDYDMITAKYKDWFLPKIDQSIFSQITHANIALAADGSSNIDHIHPQIMISYQWGRQKDILILYERLNRLGYRCWLDLFQMAGGDSLFEKIDEGVRHAKCILACVTPKYIKSANCRREMLLADALGKVIMPLLLETTETWPPPGPMGPIFTERAFIDFRQTPETPQTTDIWSSNHFDEVLERLKKEIPEVISLENPKTGEPEQINPEGVDSKTDSSKNVDANTPNPQTADSSTAGSNTLNSNTTETKSVDANTANSQTAYLSTADSNTLNSNTTETKSVNANTANSQTADPSTAGSNTTHAENVNSKTRDTNIVPSKTEKPVSKTCSII